MSAADNITLARLRELSHAVEQRWIAGPQVGRTSHPSNDWPYEMWLALCHNEGWPVASLRPDGEAVVIEILAPRDRRITARGVKEVRRIVWAEDDGETYVAQAQPDGLRLRVTPDRAPLLMATLIDLVTEHLEPEV